MDGYGLKFPFFLREFTEFPEDSPALPVSIEWFEAVWIPKNGTECGPSRRRKRRFADLPAAPRVIRWLEGLGEPCVTAYSALAVTGVRICKAAQTSTS